MPCVRSFDATTGVAYLCTMNDAAADSSSPSSSQPDAQPTVPTATPLFRQPKIMVAALLLLAHAAGAILVLRLLPQGFPFTHIKFVANTALPWTGLALTAAALTLLFRRQTRLLLACVIAINAAWLSGGTSAVILFGTSLPRAPWLFIAIGSFGLIVSATVAWARGRRARAMRQPAIIAALLLGTVSGTLVALAQRAPAPSTRPRLAQLDPSPQWTTQSDPPTIEPRTGIAAFDATSAQVDVSCGTTTVFIRPLLTFESRSPDRTWTLLAPPSNFGAQRQLRRVWQTAQASYARYADDGESSLLVTASADGVAIDAQSHLPTAVYSHLNSFASLQFAASSAGAQIAFSPTGDNWFDIRPADYPSGRPSRMVNRYADGTFRVVEASDGEKGPFHTLGESRLSSEAPLTIRVRTTAGDPTSECSFEFADWAAQASTALSPSAGWGVPQNSIQFFANPAQTHVLILLTLADTGPGIGWDSVGHASGGYRNRITVRQR